MAVAAALALALSAVCAVAGWQRRVGAALRGGAVLASVALLGAAVVLAMTAAAGSGAGVGAGIGAGVGAGPAAGLGALGEVPGVLRAGGWVAAVVAAAAGGGPVAELVLRAAGRRRPRTDASTEAAIARAGEVLRGGATIGVLERGAVAMTLLAGYPEGVAVVVAVKALGRYPELRAAGASERFIIGTLVSLVWAVAAAGVGAAVFGGGPVAGRP